MKQRAFNGSGGRIHALGAHSLAVKGALTKGVCVLLACSAAACGAVPEADKDPSSSSIQAALSFSPLDLAPVAWYEASSGTVTLAGTAVTEWLDSSGNGHDLTQTSSANRPAYSATSWNGASPSITFDGSNDFLEYPSSSGGLLSPFDGSDQPFTVLITWEPLDLDADYDLMQWDNGGISGGNSLIELRTNAAGDDEARYRHRRGDGTTTLLNTGTPKFELDRRTAGFVFSGTALTIYDGDSTHLSNGSNDVGSLVLVRYRLGHGDNMPLNGRISEVVIIASTLTQSQYSEYRAYAQDRWGGL
jgi:hypothetical protein